jgi:hypothetical protein
MSVQHRDYTGIDSLTAFVASIVMFLFVQFLERNGPLFTIRGQTPYVKEIEEKEVTDDLKLTDHTSKFDPSVSASNGRVYFDERLEK